MAASPAARGRESGNSQSEPPALLPAGKRAGSGRSAAEAEKVLPGGGGGVVDAGLVHCCSQFPSLLAT